MNWPRRSRTRRAPVAQAAKTSLDGAARDAAVTKRRDDSSLGEVWRAVQDGVNLAGYFHWSLMDDFGWARGYRALRPVLSWTS
jgi:hypothetical protein